MCQNHAHRHSIYCILPPYILNNIAAAGNEEQRAEALAALSIGASYRLLRGLRLAAPVRGITPSIPTVTGATSRLNRRIYDADSGRTLPGKLVRSEGQGPVSDVAVNEAYEGLGATYNFFWEMLQRNSIDGNGMGLDACVHYDQQMNNAFWDGERMVFGDGDAKLFNRFTLALDVIGHELAHGVTEYEAQLIYHGESGALNESMSDVFGSLIKQYYQGQVPADQADWLIGEGLLAEGVRGVALRSMKEPGSAFNDPVLGQDPQPGHMDDYIVTFEDNAGVHLNSGIPNKAFYLAAVSIGGFAGEKAGRIWYEALRDPRLKPNATFQEFAELTYRQANRLFPNGPEQDAVGEAWEAVGITVRPMQASARAAG